MSATRPPSRCMPNASDSVISVHLFVIQKVLRDEKKHCASQYTLIISTNSYRWTFRGSVAEDHLRPAVILNVPSWCLHRWLPTWAIRRETMKVCNWFIRVSSLLFHYLFHQTKDSLCYFVSVTEWNLFSTISFLPGKHGPQPYKHPRLEYFHILCFNFRNFFPQILVAHGYADKYKTLMNL